MKCMTPGWLAPGALAFLAVIAAPSAEPAVRPALRQAMPAASASPLMVFGGRSTAQVRSASGRKLDAALADLTRHAALARPGSLLDLRSLNPAAHFMQPKGSGPLVLIDAVTRGNPQQMKAALVSLGLRHPSVYSNDVSGWLPLTSIDAAAARAEVVSMRAAMFHTRAGAVTSQGDFAQGSATARTSWPGLDGSGVTVGVLSDSFNCYAVYEMPGSGVPQGGGTGYAPAGFTADAQKDMSTGDLPASVNVLEEAGQLSSQGTCMDYGAPQLPPYADEGRAMLQIVHDVAPGAGLAFHTASEGEADFANGITALAAAGAKVIADDVGYFDEPFFQDGVVAQAVDTVAAQGVAYFSAAGNNGHLSYENLTPKFTGVGSGPTAGEQLLNFDASGVTNTTLLSVTIPALQQGDFMAVVVEWDQPYVTGAPGSPGASSSIDLCISSVPTGTIVVNLDGNSVTCTGPNATGTDAVQVLIIGSPANAASPSQQTTVTFQIGLANGTPPGRVKLVVEDDGAGSTINVFDTQSPTLQGHPGAAGADAVGAVFFANTISCGASVAKLEPYSSAGGDPILFDTSGTRLATPVVRQKPEFVGADGVNTTFFIYPLADYGVTDSSPVAQCANDTSFPNFFGTSAATPHAAGAAALMLQANPALTPAQITTALETTAQAIATTPPDYNSGYGFINVDAAMASLPASAPVVTVTPDSIAPGQSATLSWIAVNSSSCTASGSWSGAQPPSGTQTLKPTAQGSDTYTLTCTTAAGAKSASATLTVAALTGGAPGPSGGGGGGGAIEALTLLALSGLAFLRLARRVR